MKITPDEKTIITSFLNLAADYLKDGHVHSRDAQSDEEIPLPLAYLVEEALDQTESDETSDQDETQDLYLSDSAKYGDSDYSTDSLQAVAAEISACRGCALAATRTFTVPGEGVKRPLVMVIGEGPGADEDKAGRPFVGKAGQLLDKMLESIGLSRKKNCYIANMVKCRPPENRDPYPEEMAACFRYLKRQIILLRPQVILCAGRVAAKYLLKTSKGIKALHGEFAELRLNDEIVIPLLPTFHPSALLRDDSNKRPAWEDLKLLRSRLDFQDYSSAFPNEE